MIVIKRALISVSDKTGIIDFAAALERQGCEIISTGGTRKVLEDAGIRVTGISSVTGNPEAFGGRMKTLSFQIGSALLYDREKDADEASALGIAPIDLVVCNLYPFDKAKAQGAGLPDLIEHIDIGGPTMVRAAAKNYKYVAAVVDPLDYPAVLEELQAGAGALSEGTRFRLMRKAFNHTADYDALIATTLDAQAGELSVRPAFDRAKKLRYGENAHQEAYFLRQRGAERSYYDMEVLHGKELSYNNMVDMYGALESLRDMRTHACAVIKHANPCGLSSGDEQRKVLEYAWAGDPVSAYGSVIAFNSTVTRETVTFFALDAEDRSERKFVEIVVAPAFTPDALEYLQLHKNLRIVGYDPRLLTPGKDMKFLHGALLYQDPDMETKEKVEYATVLQPRLDAELLDFGLKTVRQIKSNAICAVRKTEQGYCQLLGMGCGQPNRLNSTELTVKRCRENLLNAWHGAGDPEAYIREKMAEAVLFSDAFFPFPDNVEVAHAAGIRTIVQPGGSIRDKAVIARANELGMAMVLTGMRHFKH
ncbi:MAG: bifunctional phosphoribosylaminoimidazolecarboxamide formyltransferase/IMP cyclohydrolase, partial [Candidatus Marinimicrobia bacterium]|nr:bifunctional phosphoribosylaminoimidazolecarboxamide formyltransferase/IMP cyclohydrolase [Candidatus Neomarinimicrobiota bacterium]